MNRMLNTGLALTLAAASILVPSLAVAQASGEAVPSSGEGTLRDTNRPAGDTKSVGQTGSLTNGDNTGEAGGSEQPTSAISPAQQAQIRDLLKAETSEPAPADVDARVGVVVPVDGVVLKPLPVAVTKIAPAFESHAYFVMADGRIVIVNPASREVVSVLKG